MKEENEELKVRSSLWSNIFKEDSDEQKILTLLRKFPAFAELKKKELKLIRKIVQVREYIPGEIIFYEGDPGVSMFFIESGKVEISHTFKSGIKQELALLFAGDFMGELSAIVEGYRTASATALTQTRLLVIFRADLVELIIREPSLGIKILLGFSKIYVEKLRNLNRDYINLYELLHLEKQNGL